LLLNSLSQEGCFSDAGVTLEPKVL